MKIIQRYFIVNLVWTTALALAVLVGVFAFLSLIDQLEDAGQGNYDTYQAINYVLLTLPRLAYEILPIAAMIGGMTCMALLHRNSELDIIRLAGVSEYTLAGYLAKAALVIALFSVLLGELVVPVSEIKARYQRSIALAEQVVMQTQYGFWARDGNSFINIRKILPGNLIEEIYIYEFDEQDRMRSSISADTGQFIDGRWLLENVERTVIDSSGLSREHYSKATWASWIDDGLINLIIVNPLHMSLWNLSDNISALKSNSQNAAAHERAFYGKLARPFTIIAMIILSIPLVAARARSDGLGQHVFAGALIGVIFYFINSASGHIGIVYGIHPLISSNAPTLLLCLVLFTLFYRRKPVLSPKTDRETSSVPHRPEPRETQGPLQTTIQLQEKI